MDRSNLHPKRFHVLEHTRLANSYHLAAISRRFLPGAEHLPLWDFVAAPDATRCSEEGSRSLS
jgi:hypothetical protein